MTPDERIPAKTSIAGRVGYFWRLLETEHVRITVDLRREINHDAPSGPTIYWDCSMFPDEIAKALVTDRKPSDPIADVIRIIDDLIEGIRNEDHRPFSGYAGSTMQALQMVRDVAIASSGAIHPRHPGSPDMIPSPMTPDEELLALADRLRAWENTHGLGTSLLKDLYDAEKVVRAASALRATATASAGEGVRDVARVICKSRTCLGISCCQWPAQAGTRHKCPVDRGNYDEAAKDVLAFLAPTAVVAPDGVREALAEAVAVFEGMCDDEIEVELLPRLRAALTSLEGGVQKEGSTRIEGSVANEGSILSRAAKFVAWAMREGPWDGGDLDGCALQEKAEKLGLIIETTYDPKVHGESNHDVEAGDQWFVLHPEIVVAETRRADSAGSNTPAGFADQTLSLGGKL